MSYQYTSDLTVEIITSETTCLHKAGDWVQAVKTTQALRQLGVNVRHIVIKGTSNPPEMPDDVVYIPWQELNKKADVWHFIHAWGIPGDCMEYIRQSQDKPKCIAASTVYWSSSISEKVLLKNLQVSASVKLKMSSRRFLTKLGVNKRNLEGIDLLLPNSQAEIIACKRDITTSPSTVYAAIPNGIDPVPQWAFDVPEPEKIKGREYILCPGIFAPRKNQIGLIRAMRDSDIPIVFMGGVMENQASRLFYEKCKKEAGDNCLFVGKMAHGSEEFYGFMRHARVVCLSSNCETPGIALLEAARMGARPVGPTEGGIPEYLGFDAEYCNPLSDESIKQAVTKAWARGRLDDENAKNIDRFDWINTGKLTLLSYNSVLASKS